MSDVSNIPDVCVEGLRFSYDGNEVIRGLDLEAARGSFCGILGPNGSGKTTLVKILTGVLRRSGGKVEIMGEPVERWNQRKLARNVAVVPQATHVAFPFTALEVVLMGRAPHLGGLAIESREDIDIAHDAMNQTGTWELRGRTMQELSGGEAQRVIVARALAQKPRILLLDEPTTHLDIKHQIAVMELIIKLNKTEGLTVLIVSHDLNLIARYAERVMLIKDGVVRADGAPGDVLTAEKIRGVYDAEVEVFDLNGRPGIFPAGQKAGSNGGAS
jgi:iron complex transport system ATP-binding protein